MTTPTDNDLIEGSALAIGLDPVFRPVEGEPGYWTVAARGGVTKRTPWNPLTHASQSQRLQAELTMATYTHEDGSVEAAARAKDGAQHMVNIAPYGQPVSREATLRRAIAHVAFMCRPGAKP